MLISSKGNICIDSSYDALQAFRHSRALHQTSEVFVKNFPLCLLANTY